MKVWPLRFREIGEKIVFADDTGSWFWADAAFLARYVHDRLNEEDVAFLRMHGHVCDDTDGLNYTAFAWRWTQRLATAGTIGYVMLVPTLRCTIKCQYCQVSRVAEDACGFDWSEETLKAVLRYLDSLETDEIKVEFQGGEPTLRLDLMQAVRDFCRERFRRSQFIVCTNLQRVSPEIWDFFDSEDTFISTSIDGDFETHNRQRAQDEIQTSAFFSNVAEAVKRFGSDRLSALPTIDPYFPPDMDQLINIYEDLGIRSIYLRSINYQGFARKLKSGGDGIDVWNRLYSQFIDRLILRNARANTFVEEFYFSHTLKRLLSYGQEQHVNIRNPNLLGTNYCVVDYDGAIYPTDESRMLARIGHVDLGIGNVASGIDEARRDQMNGTSMNNFDPDCIHCPYQPYCGVDIVDDLSRYGRHDLPRHDTWFCRRQLAVFDKVLSLIARKDEETDRSLARWAGLETWPARLNRCHK